MIPALKRALLKPLLVPGFTEALAALTDTRGSIFMLHRFAVPDLGVEGDDPAVLRRVLAHLRKHRYELVSLEEMFRRLREQRPLRRTVAFTIDDGYFDHARIAAPVFAEFDCPATIFVTTDFIDGKSWFWWDRLEHIFHQTQKSEVRAKPAGREIRYRLDGAGARAWASRDLASHCKEIPDADRLACILEFSNEAEVELPGAAPPRYAPLSWDEARSLEKRGITFGPHTVTHPVLAMTPAAQSEFEIVESWKRLSANVRRPVPVFCYPNGRLKDFGGRETSILRELGLWGAVTGEPGDVRPAVFRGSGEAPYRVPRFGYQNSLPHLLQSVSGLEMLKARMRGVQS